MTRCETCGEVYVPEGPQMECGSCKSAMYDEMYRAGREEAFGEISIYLDDLIIVLREQLALHADEWRSDEVEYPADQRAKAALARAEEWLTYA